jgi:uncharacterized membrane protein YjjP (DUF1212 family)
MFEKEKLMAGELSSQIKEYFKARVDLFYLKLSDRLSSVLSGILSMILIAFFFLFFLLFISIALAKFLAGLFNNDMLGYLVVGLIYFIFLLIIVYFKDNLIKEPLANRIMDSFNRDQEQDEE